METLYKTYQSPVDLHFESTTVSNLLYIPDNMMDYIYSNDFYWIYYIYDKNDDNERPIYIGKTLNINNRAHKYYNSVTKYYDSLTHKAPVISYLHDNGIQNFSMKILYITKDPEIASIVELGSIVRYDTIKHGLNAHLSSNSTVYKSKDEHHSIVKSKLFFVINPSIKKGYICTGLKLAGQVIGGISKDNIKTAARRGVPRNGYYMYYLTYVDFELVKEAVQNKLNKGIFYGPKNSRDMGDSTESYKTSYTNFIKYGKYIKDYLKFGKNPENIFITYVTQDHKSDCGYKIIDPDEFVKEYNNNPFKIYSGRIKGW